MNRRKAWILGGAAAAVILIVVITLLNGSHTSGPGAAPSSSTLTPSTPPEASPPTPGSDQPVDPVEPNAANPQPTGEGAADGEAAPAQDGGPAGGTHLCDRVTAATFEELTGLTVELAATSAREQCDYTILGGLEGTFARVTQRPLEDYSNWAGYAATQPDGPDITRPAVADGAYVSVVDGGDISYVTAEAGVGTTIVTWELALPANPTDAREQATALLRAAVRGMA